MATVTTGFLDQLIAKTKRGCLKSLYVVAPESLNLFGKRAQQMSGKPTLIAIACVIAEQVNGVIVAKDEWNKVDWLEEGFFTVEELRQVVSKQPQED